MYGIEGTVCAATGSLCEAPRDRHRASVCPACRQRLWFAASDGTWPEHRVPPEAAPGDLTHRNDAYPPLEARSMGCLACSDCGHEPDDAACMDGCYDPVAGAWLPFEAAWACDNCGHPVVGRETKAAVIGTW